MLEPGDGWQGPPLCLVLNKMDLLGAQAASALMSDFRARSKADTILAVSAKVGASGACCVLDKGRLRPWSEGCKPHLPLPFIVFRYGLAWCEPLSLPCPAAQEAKGIVELKEWMVSKMPEGPSLFNKDYLSQAPERFFGELPATVICHASPKGISPCDPLPALPLQCPRSFVRKYSSSTGRRSPTAARCARGCRRRACWLRLARHVRSDSCRTGTQVNVVEFKERKVGKDFIKVEILVEKDGQRGILMGAGGTAIKRLNTAARLDIEAFLGRPVFLEMTVKAQKGWRDDADLLKRYGY